MLSRGWYIESNCGIYFTKPIYWSLFYSRIREIIQDHERSRVFLTYVIFLSNTSQVYIWLYTYFMWIFDYYLVRYLTYVSYPFCTKDESLAIVAHSKGFKEVYYTIHPTSTQNYNSCTFYIECIILTIKLYSEVSDQVTFAEFVAHCISTTYQCLNVARINSIPCVCGSLNYFGTYVPVLVIDITIVGRLIYRRITTQ